jgi:hypothetical protein
MHAHLRRKWYLMLLAGACLAFTVTCNPQDGLYIHHGEGDDWDDGDGWYDWDGGYWSDNSGSHDHDFQFDFGFWHYM